MLLAARRADETADLLVTALTRDMRGVQNLVLSSSRWDELLLDPPNDASNVVASAFARYPYPESFFFWRAAPTRSGALFLHRSDRPPMWTTPRANQNRFPVTVRAEPAVSSRLIDRIARDAALGRRFSLFEIELNDTSYQVVARLMYKDPFREDVQGVFGFTVNLPWVRKNYFSELTNQVAHIGTTGAGLDLAVLDEEGALVTHTQAAMRIGPTNQRPFSLMFFDPRLVALDPPADLPRRGWLVQVSASGDPTLVAAIQGADRTLMIAALAAVALALGLVMTGRATRVSAKLAEMRSEFVSTVTHELKTPIATIRAAGDTLLSGRISSPAASREYAQMVVEEAKRLTRLVDNLLAYARITDVADVYSFESFPVDVIITEMLQGFRPQLTAGAVEVLVDIPSGLPPVRVDRTAIELLLDNLVDNAIRYSPERRLLHIRASADESHVRIDVSDRGIGIPDDEIGRITRKFVRGRRAGSGGSGLGLAIATRIAKDHGGTLAIASIPNMGTTVSVTLPIASIDYEEAYSGH